MSNESQSERKQGRSIGFRRVLTSAAFLLLAVLLSVFAVGLLASYGGFGIIPDTPRDVADLRSENVSLQQTVTALQARGLDLEQGSSANAQDIAALEQEMQTLDQRMNDLEQQAQDLVLLSNDLQDNIDEVATIQAESEEGRMAIVVMATVLAEREDRLVQIEDGLNDVRERTNRLFRFIERLNDLTGQTENGLDLLDETPGTNGAPAGTPTPETTSPDEASNRTAPENDRLLAMSPYSAEEHHYE